MKVKDFIQNNPYRVLGVFTNDSFDVMSSHNSFIKAVDAIGKFVYFSQDMDRVFGKKPNRQPNNLHTSMSALSSPMGRLTNGMFWFMDLTATDAKALAVLAKGGDLLAARKIWENDMPNISSIQNQLMCCLLMDSRSYSKALLLASILYTNYGNEFIVTVSNGFDVITPDQLMSTFFTEIIKASDGDCSWWDKAVKRYGNEVIERQWAEAKASLHISKLQDALNVAKGTEIHTTQDNYSIAVRLMDQAEPHLKELKTLKDKHPILLSRYATITDAVCEEILNREIEYFNHTGWFKGFTERVLTLERFCYRYAATIRLKDRCKFNINITLGRKKDAPLFPDGTPDNLTEYERKKRNAGICDILAALESKNNK